MHSDYNNTPPLFRLIIDWMLAHKIVLSLLFIIAISLTSLFLYYKMKEARKLYREYPNYYEIHNLCINGIIVKIFPYYRGSVFIDLDNGLRLDLVGVHRNYKYNQPDIIDFIQLGDSLSKQSNSDTLYIYRDNKEYYFILGKVINKKD